MDVSSGTSLSEEEEGQLTTLLAKLLGPTGLQQLKEVGLRTNLTISENVMIVLFATDWELHVDELREIDPTMEAPGSGEGT